MVQIFLPKIDLRPISFHFSDLSTVTGPRVHISTPRLYCYPVIARPRRALSFLGF